MHIKLYREALNEIILHAAKCYELECFGYLHGRRENGRISILKATEGPVKKRTKTRLITTSNDAQVERRLESIVGIPIIGDFHSHTENGEEACTDYSYDDKNSDLFDMLRAQKLTYFIVAIRDKIRQKEWKTTRSGELAGTDTDFDCAIAAYVLNQALYDKLRADKRKVKFSELNTRQRENMFLRAPIYLRR